MTEQEFISKMMEDVLDTEDNITLSARLEDLEAWDSLSFVSFIAMAREAGYTDVNRNSISEAKTVMDLFNLVK